MATTAVKKETVTTRSPAAKKPVAKKAAPVTAAKKAAPVRTAARVGKTEAVVRTKATPAKPEVVADIKIRKPKLVRDSFTMPEAEYAVLGQVKKACLKAGIEVKKSQLLRLGLVLLNKTDVPALKKLIAELAPLKAGRPKKEK
ncbi:hypothetical protein [Undibacterium oligocarboniphilum]|uniref:Uncharacterized protein n=1 Tax=Undibacterium oligocarboniphilum TaxID=666702 RepID=A0A850QR23_9BURK|nr:hypothetical protein [Undibacterium oligocarboniphilum]MBC3871337.1 hypothetical protein [Undibacterium oligocarboniphilum]NVO78834.1 hypothetical protein [Undibacterium oligocarboniphilum]